MLPMHSSWQYFTCAPRAVIIKAKSSAAGMSLPRECLLYRFVFHVPARMLLPPSGTLYASGAANMSGRTRMRYHIDTIPVWDAVKQKGDCPLCALRRRNELIDVERFLGGSVMEPDTRIQVNQKGFCPRHQALLYAQKNRLGHALMMHTHLKETIGRAVPVLEEARAAAEKGAGTPAVKRLLGKNYGKQDLRAAARRLRAISSTCILCDTIEENTRRYAYTLMHLYKTDAAFRQAFAAALEKTMRKNETDLEGFTLKFDYRNADKPWGDSKGSLERTVNQLHGWCLGEEPNPK